MRIWMTRPGKVCGYVCIEQCMGQHGSWSYLGYGAGGHGYCCVFSAKIAHAFPKVYLKFSKGGSFMGIHVPASPQLAINQLRTLVRSWQSIPHLHLHPHFVVGPSFVGRFSCGKNLIHHNAKAPQTLDIPPRHGQQQSQGMRTSYS